MKPIPTLVLNDGHHLPALGLGTYKLKGADGVRALTSAMANGYRLLDSAFNYENEGTLGEAVRAAGLARDALHLTSKLPGRHQRFDAALATIEESLYRARIDHWDLYLIHWPNPARGLYVEAWRALIEARRRGLVRSIGVSNFLPEHLNTLGRETGVLPAVNQVELHPYFPQAGQLAFDGAHGIVTQAWSPLGRANALLQEPILQAIAQRLGRSVAQVILRWQVQLGAVPLPKASSAARQVENRSVFDFALSEQDLADIATLARADGRLAGQDPAHYEEF
ncbi:MAG: aldo/keto reductase [Proteobacteria bacterium]|nr:aldo/keto reductase [Pseudomonadota bacterium]